MNRRKSGMKDRLGRVLGEGDAFRLTNVIPDEIDTIYNKFTICFGEYVDTEAAFWKGKAVGFYTKSLGIGWKGRAVERVMTLRDVGNECYRELIDCQPNELRLATLE